MSATLTPRRQLRLASRRIRSRNSYHGYEPDDLVWFASLPAWLRRALDVQHDLATLDEHARPRFREFVRSERLRYAIHDGARCFECGERNRDCTCLPF